MSDNISASGGAVFSGSIAAFVYFWCSILLSQLSLSMYYDAIEQTKYLHDTARKQH